MRAIRDTHREEFRIVQYSVQSDRIHLLVEADAGARSRAMRSFSIRTANRGDDRAVLRRA